MMEVESRVQVHERVLEMLLTADLLTERTWSKLVCDEDWSCRVRRTSKVVVGQVQFSVDGRLLETAIGSCVGEK